MLLMGATPEVAERFRTPPASDFPVFPENWETLRFFLRLNTQWNVIAGSSGIVILGLNYQSVELLLNVHEVEDRRRLMDDLQAMEGAALAVLNK